MLDPSYQGAKRLFVLTYNNTVGDDQVSIDSFKKYFLPRAKIENYNIKIDGKIFYDQSINYSIKQYNEIRKNISKTRWWFYNWLLVRFCLFWKKNGRLTAADWSKQKALDDDSKAIQQITFTGKIKSTAQNTGVIIYYILEQSKEAILEFAKGTAKVL